MVVLISASRKRIATLCRGGIRIVILLGDAANFQIIADILGNTEAIVRKHYAKWSKGRQENIDRLMMAHFQWAGDTNPVTKMSQEMGAVN